MLQYSSIFEYSIRELIRFEGDLQVSSRIDWLCSCVAPDPLSNVIEAGLAHVTALC